MFKTCTYCPIEQDISEFGTRQRKLTDSSVKIYLYELG